MINNNKKIWNKYTGGEKWAICLIALPFCTALLFFVFTLLPFLNHFSIIENFVTLIFVLSFTIIPIVTLVITIFLKIRGKALLRTILLWLAIIENSIIGYIIFAYVIPLASDFS